jgi:hypothetical protein
MNHAEALQKAAKLLRLSTSSNPHEAALALSRAQEIMDRFKLSADAVNGAGSEVHSDEPIANFDFDPLERATKVDRWKTQLSVSIAKANQCRVYLGNGGICLIGRASDVQTVRYMFAWLVREIERLAARDCKGAGRTYWNNFRLGAVESVAKRLRESATETIAAVKSEAFQTGGQHALMIVEKSAALMVQRAAEVDEWTKKNMRLRSGGSHRTTYNESARDAGRRAGASINLRGSSGRLGSGQGRLGI